MKTVVFLAFLYVVAATTHFKETFDDGWEKRWVVSDWKKSEGTAGEWKHTAGEWYGDAQKDKGIQTTPDARFYAISAKFSEFSNKGKDLVVQFQIRHPQSIDCGGGYIKVLSKGIDQKKFSGDTPYDIMFGPDICGTSTRKVHAIFTYKGNNLLWKKTPSCETDQLSHVYTLILKPDQTYDVRIDGKSVGSGNLLDDWDFLPPKMIKDPSASKPSDWVDQEFIDDPSDKKPSDWDNVPKQIPDPDAEKPEDWDDESDGAWEPPMIDNPEYKGEWKPKQITNPAYKGKWVHPEISNPEFKEDKDVYVFPHLSYVGFELWQVKAGTIVDNIIVTDSVSEAETFMNDTWGKSKDAEKAMFENIQKKKRDQEEAARKDAEAASSKKKDDDEDEEDEDDDDDKKKKDKEEL
jgi:calreticulin